MRAASGWELMMIVVAAVLIACEPADPAAELASLRVDRFPAASRDSLDFSQLAPGDTLLGLRIDSISVLPDPVDSFGWMGTVDYSGEVSLVGDVRPHFDYPEVPEICFFADDSVAARLPRFPNDVRRSWLCFSNQEEAAARLGPAGEVVRASIRIDRFHYIYRHTDVYNRGHLLEAEPLR